MRGLVVFKCSRAALTHWQHYNLGSHCCKENCGKKPWDSSLGALHWSWDKAQAWIPRFCLCPTMLLAEPNWVAWLMACLDLPLHYCYFFLCLETRQGKEEIKQRNWIVFAANVMRQTAGKTLWCLRHQPGEPLRTSFPSQTPLSHHHSPKPWHQPEQQLWASASLLVPAPFWHYSLKPCWLTA